MVEQFEKVEKGLECHSDAFTEEPDCMHCPYDNAYCGHEVPADALSLIRAQQERIRELESVQTARVMTLDDAAKADVCWLEVKDMDRVMSGGITIHTLSNCLRALRNDSQKTITERNCAAGHPGQRTNKGGIHYGNDTSGSN